MYSNKFGFNLGNLRGERGEPGPQGPPGSSNLTVTNPTVSEICVFGSTSTTAPILQKATATVTCSQPLSITGLATANAGLVVPSSDSNFVEVGPGVAQSSTLGTVLLQSCNGGAQGFASLAFNGYFNGSTDTRVVSTKNRWRINVDQRSTTDTMYFDTFNGTSVTTFLTFTTAGAATFGSTVTATGATLSGPLSITTTGQSALNISDNFNPSVNITNTNAGNKRCVLNFNESNGNPVVQFGTDPPNSGRDGFYLYSSTLGAQNLICYNDDGSSGALQAVRGLIAPELLMTSQASQPSFSGYSGTMLWSKSTDTTHPYFGANQVALFSDIPTSVQSQLTSISSSGSANCSLTLNYATYTIGTLKTEWIDWSSTACTLSGTGGSAFSMVVSVAFPVSPQNYYIPIYGTYNGTTYQGFAIGNSTAGTLTCDFPALTSWTSGGTLTLQPISFSWANNSFG